MDALLTYDSVEISFGGTAVVRDVSFSLHPGEIVGLVPVSPPSSGRQWACSETTVW